MQKERNKKKLKIWKTKKEENKREKEQRIILLVKFKLVGN